MNEYCKCNAKLAMSLAAFSLLFGFVSCETATNLISSTHFSQNAYDTDTNLKDDALALIDRAKGRTSYSSVTADVAMLMQKIDNTIGVEKNRTKNAPTVAQWETIQSQLSHFFDLWKTKGTLSPAFVDEGRTQIGGLFDTLIRTEEDKRARG